MQHHEMDFDPEIATMMNDLLNQLFFDINSLINSAIEPTFISGLTQQLADDVSQNYYLMRSLDAMQTNNYYIREDYVETIHNGIVQVCNFWAKLKANNLHSYQANTFHVLCMYMYSINLFPTI